MTKDEAKEWLKSKKVEAQTWADIQVFKAKQWAKENPEQAATVFATACGALGIIIKKSVKASQLRKETVLKERYIYDRSLGRYWMLRRAPTQSEALAIESMRRQGLGYGDILTRLRLL